MCVGEKRKIWNIKANAERCENSSDITADLQSAESISDLRATSHCAKNVLFMKITYFLNTSGRVEGLIRGLNWKMIVKSLAEKKTNLKSSQICWLQSSWGLPLFTSDYYNYLFYIFSYTFAHFLIRVSPHESLTQDRQIRNEREEIFRRFSRFSVDVFVVWLWSYDINILTREISV